MRRSIAAVVSLVLLGCRTSSPPTAPANAAPVAPAPDAAPEPSACERYHALAGQAAECAALSDEVKQDLVQRETDMGAAISESGMDDSTPVDAEALCQDEVDYILRVAAACHLR